MTIKDALINIKAVCKKEIHLLINSAFSPFFLFLYFIFSALVSIAANILWKGQDRVFLLLSILPIMHILFLPIIAIRAMQIEGRSSSWKLLLSFPLKIEIVLFGKILIGSFFSFILSFGNLLLVSILVPKGEMTFSLFLIQNILLYFLNTLILSFSLFFASLFSKRILSYLSSVSCLLVALYVPFPFFNVLYPYSKNAVPFRFIDRLAVFNLEAISVSDLLFFLLISVVFFFLTVTLWEKKRKGGRF